MRAIDGDKVIGAFYDLCSKRGDPTVMLGLGYISAFIESEEIAITLDDLRPKGQWEDNHCSVCGMMPMGDEMWRDCPFDPPKFEYFMDSCPSCGADMRGGGEDG